MQGQGQASGCMRSQEQEQGLPQSQVQAQSQVQGLLQSQVQEQEHPRAQGVPQSQVQEQGSQQGVPFMLELDIFYIDLTVLVHRCVKLNSTFIGLVVSRLQEETLICSRNKLAILRNLLRIEDRNDLVRRT